MYSVCICVRISSCMCVMYTCAHVLLDMCRYVLIGVHEFTCAHVFHMLTCIGPMSIYLTGEHVFGI